MAANSSPLKIVGELECLLRCKDTAGRDATANATFYIADNIPDTYISLSTMRDLRMIPKDSPTPQCAAAPTSCQCPQRELPPPRPDRLPFEPTAENIPRMKEWLLQRYASSTFNQCTHTTLPEMTGPPMEIHLLSLIHI